jgi:transcriptional regulator with XRE-family HTH domain
VNAHAGTMLRDARTAKGLLQWEAARDAGMTASRLSVIETGKAPVRPLDAARLAPVLGLDEEDLMRAPRPEPAVRRTALPARTAAASRAVLARSFKDIPATCPCDWRMTFEKYRPSGWELTVVRGACMHHGSGR